MQAIGLLLVIMIFFWIYNFIMDSVESIGGWHNVLIIIMITFVVAYITHTIKQKLKYKKLLNKYNDQTIVENIMNKTLWQGETKEQVEDSLGYAQDVDEKVFKLKTRETWKYQHESGNRYRLRVFIENDIVVGWEQR